MKQIQIKKSFAILMTLVLILGGAVIPQSKVANAATKLKVTCSKKTIYAGATTKVKANVKATFKSSNTAVASVSSKGIVKGKKAGTAKITVTSKANKKQKKTIKIKVIKKKSAPTQPTTEKPKLQMVGIRANYRGEKVPNDISKIRKFGVNLEAVFNDGSTIAITPSYADLHIIEEKEEETNGKHIATFCVEYQGFTTTMQVELVDVDSSVIYPTELAATYSGGVIDSSKQLSINDINLKVRYSNGTYETVVDKKNIRAELYWYYPSIKEYVTVYDYTFKDTKGNDLYICVYDSIGVPYNN
ncbi:MAG: Ig-like domain-containing protein [Oscillospiraceae bacterium]|nr:Ig-like domain-containing protein [Oscillospiraceae bacterium]